MKLYATTTSERASKGQGGNDFLEINVQDENKHTFLELKILPKDEYIQLSGWVVQPSARRSEQYFEFEVQKGEKQKGDRFEGWTSADFEAFDKANNS